MNVEPETISHSRISLSRAKRRTDNPTTPKPPDGSIENTTTLSSQTRELNPLTPTSESPIMIIEANEQQEPVVSPKSNKKIVSIKPKKITITRTQSKSPVLEQEISIKSPVESPINFPRFDGLSSPSKSPTNFRFLDGDFLTEGELLLSRNSSIPSPIGKNALSVNLAFDDSSLIKTISKTSNLYEGFNLDTPISQLGSITPHTIPDAPMIEKYRVPHKKRDNILVLNEVNSLAVSQKVGMSIDSPVLSDEEAKESPSFDVNRMKNERPKVGRNSPFNQDVTDQRVERDITRNNIRADTFDSPDQSHVNANQIANATADITSTAILINSNNANSSINTNNQQQQPQQTVAQADSATQRATGYVMSDSDIKLYLRKNVMFFLGCAVVSLFYYFIIIYKIPYHTIFITGYVYLASQVYVNIRSSRLRTDSDTWRKKEDLLNTIDVLCLTIVLLIIHLKLSFLSAYLLQYL